MEAFIENFIVENLGRVFPGSKLVEQNKMLPSGDVVDLHLLNKDGKHILVEVKMGRIKRSRVGRVMDRYTAISNLDPPIRDFELVVVSEGIDNQAKKIFNRLGISFKSLSDLGLSREVVKGFIKRRRERRLLTPLESELVSYWEANNAKLITVADVAERLESDKNYARSIIHRLEKKEWLERITRGIYLFMPIEYGYEKRYPPMNPLLVGSILVEPYYYSYATSNAYYGYTTQIRPTLYMATTKTRRAFEWRNNKFRFICLSKSKFFGYQELDIQDVTINLARPEKSIVDSVDKMKYAGGIGEVSGAVYKGLRSEIDHGKLVEYAIRMGSYSIVQRLGFLIDFAAEEGTSRLSTKERRRLLKHVGKSVVYLSPTKSHGKVRQFHRNWNLIQNVSRDQLLSEILIR